MGTYDLLARRVARAGAARVVPAVMIAPAVLVQAGRAERVERAELAERAVWVCDTRHTCA